jgi:hypothetical protein
VGLVRYERKIGSQYPIYYSFSPEYFKEIEASKEVLFGNYLGEVSGGQIVDLAGTRRFQPTLNHGGECKEFKTRRTQ